MKLFYKTADAIPDGMLSLYVERDGDNGPGFYLSLDDADLAALKAAARSEQTGPDPRVTELEAALATAKAAADTQHNELRDVKAQLGRIDVDKYARLLALESTLSDPEKTALNSGDIDRIVETRTAALIDERDRQLAEKDRVIAGLEDELTRVKRNLGEFSIDQSLMAALGAMKMRLNPGAQDDFITRGRNAWSIGEHGKPVPKAAGSNEMRYGANAEPEKMDEWVRLLSQSASHLFEKGGGGGGNPSDGLNEEPGQRYCTQADINAGRVELKDITAGRVKLRR